MRTLGATSLVSVKLSDLTDKFKPDAIILIGRRWANMNGIVAKSVTSNEENIIAAGNQPLVQEIVQMNEITAEPETVIQEICHE